MLGALAEADQCDVGALAGSDRGHVGNVDLARDHLVAEPVDDAGEQFQSIRALIRDQDAKVVNVVQALPSVEEREDEKLRRRADVLAAERASRVAAEIVANTTILHQSGRIGARLVSKRVWL